MKPKHKITNGDIKFWKGYLQFQDPALDGMPFCRQLLKLAKSVKEIQDQETVEK